MSFLSRRENSNKLRYWIFLFVIAEALAWLSFNFQALNIVILSLIALLVIIFGWWRPVWLMLIPLAELFWGSLGHSYEYLFLNSRLVIFVAVGVIFLLKYLTRFTKLKLWQDGGLTVIWLASLFLVAAGVVNAKLQGVEWADIFFDANAYLYILYLPVWLEVYDRKMIKTLFKILMASGLVVALKTIFVFHIFVQQYSFLDYETLYKWIRDTRTGEITPFSNDFQRVFMQSQLYVLVAWFVTFIRQMRDYRSWTNFWILSVLAAALLISLSRSFWLGAAVGVVFMLVVLGILNRKILPAYVYVVLAGIALGSVAIVEITYNLPKWHTVNFFSQRTVDSSEAAASSRMALLPHMWKEIKESPFIGSGFAKEITYSSSDPRIRNEENPEGIYTTYSFEWGWLEQWLKMGIGIVLVLFGWLLLIYRRGYKILSERMEIATPLLSAVVAVTVIHVFSPYLNHPLGIGLLIMTSVLFSTHGKRTFGYY